MEDDELILESELVILDEEEASIDEDEICPECGSDVLIIVSHCRTCPACGWSLCSL